jgi:hypothetical protein
VYRPLPSRAVASPYLFVWPRVTEHERWHSIAVTKLLRSCPRRTKASMTLTTNNSNFAPSSPITGEDNQEFRGSSAMMAVPAWLNNVHGMHAFHQRELAVMEPRSADERLAEHRLA